MNTSIGKNQSNFTQKTNHTQQSRFGEKPRMTKSKSHRNFKQNEMSGQNPVVIPKEDVSRGGVKKIKRIKSSKMLKQRVKDVEQMAYCPRKKSMVKETEYRSIHHEKKPSFNQKILNSYKKMINSIFKKNSEEENKDNMLREAKERENIHRNKSISNFENSKNYYRKVKKQEEIEKFVRHNRNKSLVESTFINESQNIQESRFNHETFVNFETNLSNKLFTNASNGVQPTSMVSRQGKAKWKKPGDEPEFNFFSLNVIDENKEINGTSSKEIDFVSLESTTYKKLII
jgi:hypothetical protein